MIIHGRKTGPVSKSGDRLTLMLLFYIAAVCGWLWEVLVYWGTSGFGGSLTELLVFYRGVLHGPWVPIYGTGGILLVLLYRAVQERKGYFLIAAMAVCTAHSPIREKPTMLTKQILPCIFKNCPE